MKFILKLAIFIIILSVNNTYTNIPLNLYVDYSEKETQVIINQVKVEINSIRHNLIYNWDSTKENTFTSVIKKGKYRLSAILSYSKFVDTANYEFEVIGNEKAVLIFIACLADTANAKFEEITVQKTFLAPRDLSISNKFKFKINDEPEFMLINNTKRTFYGYNIHNYFWGNIYEYINNQWVMVNSNTVCASYEENDSPLNPGDSVTATILPSYFYSDRYKFDHKGKYKFSMKLCETKYNLMFRLVKPYIQYSTRIIYNLDFEFNLE